MEKNFIFIKNFITECFIGVYPDEKIKKQKIKVSLKLKIERSDALDKLSSTVCYQKVLNILENIENLGHINLVETLANKLVKEFKRIKNVTEVVIKISKCEITKKGTDVGFILKKKINNHE